MAKQYKKIQHKVAPKKPEREKPAQKPGRDIVLIAVICFTLFLGAFGWGTFDNISRGMYAMLALSLIMTYVQRHAALSERRMRIVSRIGIAAMILAILLFALTVYRQYVAN